MSKVQASLYVHVPFCVHKCGYCDFNSWAETRREPQELWLKALSRQVTFWSKTIASAGIEFTTVFFGGGTPSLLADDLLLKAAQILRDSFSFSEDAEWNIECNPETLTLPKIETLKAATFNRLSMGIQSFQDRHLERLERHARREDNLRALEYVAGHWNGRWSADLMFALPGQTLKEWDGELSEILKFSPEHLSCYQLTLTTERAKNWSQASEDVLADFFHFTESKLAQQGFERYEISNFAKSGERARHNLAYWKLKPFLGLGPGAAGLLSPRFLNAGACDRRDEFVLMSASASKKNKVLDESPFHAGIIEHRNWDSRFGAHQKNADRFESWASGAGNALFELGQSLKPRSAKDHLFELLMMGLRLKEGVDRSRLESLVGPLEGDFLPFQLLEFIDLSPKFLSLNNRGTAILDHLLPQLFKILEKRLQSDLDLGASDPTFS